MAESKPSEKLPPGMVIGPDGKPCKVCTVFSAWTPPKKRKPASSSSGSSSSASTAATSVVGMAALAGASTGASTSQDVARDPSGLRKDCPADVERLGRHTWTFLHTAAAYYPPAPSPAQRSSMLNLLNALPTLYPCSHCADDLGKEMQQKPPEVGSREGLEKWLCDIHNRVNKRLGKETFDCGTVAERWRDGWKDGRCDER